MNLTRRYTGSPHGDSGLCHYHSISALRLRSVRFGLHKFSLVNYNALSVSDARSRSFEANLLTD
ncbi:MULTISPECIES: hypothetical protein, partial [Xenorhabdus]|uniref:hypothetical protein n=1 Tax=Xenorhabdus TaxID=626 RepID=UPI000B10F88A